MASEHTGGWLRSVAELLPQPRAYEPPFAHDRRLGPAQRRDRLRHGEAALAKVGELAQVRLGLLGLLFAAAGGVKGRVTLLREGHVRRTCGNDWCQAQPQDQLANLAR